MVAVQAMICAHIDSYVSAVDKRGKQSISGSPRRLLAISLAAACALIRKYTDLGAKLASAILPARHSFPSL